jgi:NAD-dependent SIR2 family protein deacetylase
MKNEWRKCRKRPMVVAFREVKPNEHGIETLEGFKPCDPKRHFIIKGVNGELYPIDKQIFNKTYEILE